MGTVLSLTGSGAEFILGTLDEGEIERICEDEEDIEEVLGELTEIDNVMHINGPSMDELSITDENGEEIELPTLSFDKEPTWSFKENFIEDQLTTDFINDQLEYAAPPFLEQIEPNIDLVKVFSPLASLFQEKPNGTTFLIQELVAKGDWGEIELDEGVEVEDIVLVVLDLEGMPRTALSILVGYLVFANGSLEFMRFDADESTVGKGSDRYIYDNEEGEIIWEE